MYRSNNFEPISEEILGLKWAHHSTIGPIVERIYRLILNYLQNEIEIYVVCDLSYNSHK